MIPMTNAKEVIFPALRAITVHWICILSGRKQLLAQIKC